MRSSHINDGWLDTTTTENREIMDFRGEGFDPVLSLGRFQYHCATVPLADQQHDDWLVLVFSLEGAQHYRVGEAELLLRQGQVMRVPPGLRYGTGSWPEQRGSLAWMILKALPAPADNGLGISPEVAVAAFGKLASRNGPLVFKQPKPTPYLLDGVFTAWPWRGDPLRREIIRHQLASLVLKATVELEEHSHTSDQAAGYTHARIQAVIDWLGANLHQEVRAKDLVEMSRLSTSRFFREFKAVTGVTPKDYLLRLRVEEAARLLRKDPTRPVISIAHDLGFSSSQYFATVFRRYLGISPQEHRTRGDGDPAKT
jgi:AraC-like DNA-binding protein